MANKKRVNDNASPEKSEPVESGSHEEQETLTTTEEASTKENHVEQLKEEITKLSLEKAELQDMYLRKHADFENYRKRMSKEKTESIQYANADLIEKMLDVLDNFERAKKAAIDQNDIQAVIDGINMIESNLISLLTNKGLNRLDCVDQPFNPEHHLAIAMEESEEVEEAKVIEEFQAGYLLHDRLLRTAKVKVALPKSKEEQKG
ncbi:nucleotide exchange factor GrpE [Entomospira nematocerorum]|uniref:Protein GrpE n=1 Tax=Entomospira nematocerorum TaxID=2719987 RepID=A0A968GG09_9SPIO|nr:nucleotide exchange factor GrpE [Entomospira nematocera]NIZ47126.1 nucleotide exchange factor GrpE [Entomospira nematocera]WDI34330.1 nucleotide exchange factor GrpE [Entomospira nematocera]